MPKIPARKNETAPKSKPATAPKDSAQPKEGLRDVVEQIVVALVLALFIRGFEAEAFVIPTGSMATTLMGRHKDVVCPSCGATYKVNASFETDDATGLARVARGTCQNCRYPKDVATEPSFHGDRILVMKFLYHLPFLPGKNGPTRWDVVVFKYPEGPEVNYIKRCVGLPGEELQVKGGDVRVRPLGKRDVPFRYPRRPLSHQNAMQMLVWDDDHQPAELLDNPEWQRWRPRNGTWSVDSSQSWLSGPTRTYTSAASGDNWSELRYQNIVPEPAQWDAILAQRTLPYPPRSTLITDFYSYNSNVALGTLDRTRGVDPHDWFQPDWVGDLTLSARVQATETSGHLRLELIKGGVANRCEIDLATGQATLTHGDQVLGQPVATRLKDTSAHDVVFANVDGRLTLWVDGRTPFGEGLEYDDGHLDVPAPTAADLSPVGIATRGARVAVSDLVLKRDIYYTQTPGPSDYDLRRLLRFDEGFGGPFDLLADPARFPELGQYASREYPIRPGHYMMMGDNSPCSKDSRGWSVADQTGGYDHALGQYVEPWSSEPRESWEVPEALLVGKAFYIYWPHGKPVWPNLALSPKFPDFRFPFVPNFGRMKWVR